MSHKHARGRHRALPPNWCGRCKIRTWLGRCWCGNAVTRRKAGREVWGGETPTVEELLRRLEALNG